MRLRQDMDLEERCLQKRSFARFDINTTETIPLNTIIFNKKYQNTGRDRHHEHLQRDSSATSLNLVIKKTT